MLLHIFSTITDYADRYKLWYFICISYNNDDDDDDDNDDDDDERKLGIMMAK